MARAVRILVEEAMLAAVPGSSTITARALLDEFGSFAATAVATPEALLEVPGVGRERVRARTAAPAFQGADDEPAVQ